MRIDPLSESERSERMSRVRGKGNRSTEGLVEAALVAAGIGGWIKHPNDVPGRPDFYFPEIQLAVFVDGCFWHACPKCQRRMPTTRAEFWRKKIDGNRRRDQRIRRQLWSQGYHVMRIWEHDLKRDAWLKRLRSMLRKLAAPGGAERPMSDRSS